MSPDIINKFKLLTIFVGVILLDLGDYVAEEPFHIRLLGNLDESSTVESSTKFVVEKLGKCSFTNTTTSDNRYHLELWIPIIGQPFDKLARPPIND
ncbi:Os11g0462850 [Oryza sativa Japonica Group]|uniref:Os11g0462850 protein n=1 Tax=Oryza sativa subsp. japonica TaxID=39947 RepID=A0A0P0Y249_ORYSJ|nr:hypothetical protein EE612_055437 [Oryza sativa]BAT13960.1 Os11g0462850 [Oryza sativa Japonica Group]